MKEYIEREAVRQAHIKASLTTRLIDAQPAADVAQVRHGRWEPAPCNGVYDMRCSACGFTPGIRFYSSDYCPNCGALMDGKEADHD